MHLLTQTQQTVLTNSIIFLFMVSTLFFLFSLVVMVFMFGWTVRELLKNSSAVLMLLVVSIIVPLTVSQLAKQTNSLSKAATNIQIYDISNIKINDSTVDVSFKTSEPVIAYLEFKESSSGKIIPVLPTNSLVETTLHNFNIPIYGTNGGEAEIIINGVKYDLDGKPILIPQ